MSEENYVGKTHLEVLTEIANKNTISETDEKIVKYWALQLGFKNSVVTCGLIYPEGRGEAFSINSFAREIIKKIEVRK